MKKPLRNLLKAVLVVMAALCLATAAFAEDEGRGRGLQRRRHALEHQRRRRTDHLRHRRDARTTVTEQTHPGTHIGTRFIAWLSKKA